MGVTTGQLDTEMVNITYLMTAKYLPARIHAARVPTYCYTNLLNEFVYLFFNSTK